LRVTVRAPGRLEPERQRWVAAVAAGRVERILVRPGASVEASTALVELSNPEVHLESLEAERQVAQAEAALIGLRADRDSRLLTQRGLLASAAARRDEENRNAEAASALGARGFLPAVEVERAALRAQEARQLMDVQRELLASLEAASASAIASQEGQLRRLRSIAEYQRKRLASLRVTAGVTGVVQEVLVEEGQWVVSGATLSRVVEPGRLKAVLRVPEAQARDVAIGQPAILDLRRDVASGRVERIDPGVQEGAVLVDIALDAAAPSWVRPDLSVDGTVEVARLDRVLQVRRPSGARSDGALALFRMTDQGAAAERVMTRLGRVSADAVEIRSGLAAGDVVIVSDMTRWAEQDRIQIR
jgi:multidrug resistance efflux pump